MRYAHGLSWNIARLILALSSKEPAMSLEARLANLERRCRALTILLVGVVLLGVVAAFAGAQQIIPQLPLRLQQLEIVDLNGNTRVIVGSVQNAFGVFVVDPAGQPRATLSDAPEGPMLSVANAGGNIRLLAARQGTDITLRDANGAVRALVTAAQVGAQIELHAPGGQVITIPQAGE
jgi:hypothetical protein